MLHANSPLWLSLFLLATVTGSPGDRQLAYVQCTASCTATGCLPAHSASFGHSSGSPHLYGDRRTEVHGLREDAISGGACLPVCEDGLATDRAGVAWVWPWTCEQECRYRCMWRLQSSQGRALKYHGKWPFRRTLGMQEAASVLLSVCNLVAHVVGFWRLCCTYLRSVQGLACLAQGVSDVTQGRRGTLEQTAGIPDLLLPLSDGRSALGGPTVPQSPSLPTSHENHTRGKAWTGEQCHAKLVQCIVRQLRCSWAGNSPTAQLTTLQWMWSIVFCINVMTWTASAVFHTRDVQWTERTDYFWADVSVLTNTVTALLRGLHPAPMGVVLCVFVVAVYGLHVHWQYMTQVLFDYGYNVQLCICLGILTALLWLTWVWKVHHPSKVAVTVFFVAVFSAMSLEVLDFPPFRWLVDAHALWHAATVPLTLLWYDFLQRDTLWLAQQAATKQNRTD